MRHEQPLRVTYKMALTISRLECSSGRPPGPFPFTWGSRGSTIAHWRSVRSLGYRRFAATTTSAPRHGADREHRASAFALVTREFRNFLPRYGRTEPIEPTRPTYEL